MKTEVDLEALADKGYHFEDVSSCQEIGRYDEEYVYDVEVDDDNNHTFIANDILVHNSLFISFYPAVCHCEWRNLIFNKDYLSNIDKKFVIILREYNKKIIPKFENANYVKTITDTSTLNEELSDDDIEMVLIDGDFCLHDDSNFEALLNNNNSILYKKDIKWNWSNERSFVLGIDFYRYCDLFKTALNKYAKNYNVENKEVFELEKVIKSLISIAKKRYIGDVVYEDGILYDSMEFIYLKGVELVRSSTPPFARERIMDVVKYILTHSITMNDTKDILKLINNLRKEFELADIEDISMQSSMSNYESKVIDDTKIPLTFVNGVHFSVKAAAYYNYLFSKHHELIKTYDKLKSGEKIKYYYMKQTIPVKMQKSDGTIDNKSCEVFAYTPGAFPIEFAPEIDYDTQFAKAILSPINSIITAIGLPEITNKMRVVMDIFGGLKK